MNELAVNRKEERATMPEKILLFETEQAMEMQTMQSTGLTDLGYQVAVTSDGNEAIQKLRHEGADVVVIDARTVDQNKLAFVENIVHVAPNVKIVLLTDDTTTAEWDFRWWAADAIISSSSNFNKFRKTIDSVLSHDDRPD